jgi:hypothetical protein
MQKIIIPSLLFSLFALGCSTVKDTASVSKTPATAEQLEQGKEIYTTKCGVGKNGYSSCHLLYQTNAYTPKQWSRNVDMMAPKANLTPAEKQAVLAFVQSRAKK